MLEALTSAPSVELVTDEVVAGERTLGVAVHLAYRRCIYSYNIGVDTSDP